MTEPLCAELSVTAAVSCTATGLSAEPEAGATWLSEGAAVSTGINDAALFIHSATLALHTTLLHVVWVRLRMYAWPRDRLIGRAVTVSSTQIHRCIRLFIFCQSHFVPQRYYLAGKAHNTNMFRVCKMSQYEPAKPVVGSTATCSSNWIWCSEHLHISNWIVFSDWMIGAQWQTAFWKTT